MSYLRITTQSRIRILGAISFCLVRICLANAEDTPRVFSETDIDFFETRIRPLLVKRCYACHSQQALQQDKLKAGLFLDSRKGHLTGGESGPSIVAGKPNESLLIEAVKYKSYEMPPDGKLSDKEIGLLEDWVRRGAPWSPDKTSPLPKSETKYDWPKLRASHWAWKPVVKPPLPEVQNDEWTRNEIDRFVLARLESAQLTPSPQADPETLLKRLHNDLIGLPPTPDEIDQFVDEFEQNDDAAMQSAIERLLSSPHYGERWGRHWLDVARFSEGYGGFLDNAPLDNAWRYRDWVVAAFNNDMPYDEFITLQICGDLIDKRQHGVATGFLALGPTYISDGGDPDSIAQAKSETLDDRMDTFGRGILGLTIACARCHDHKFDPIPQQDYYSLAGVFNNTNVIELPLVDQAVVDAYNERQAQIRDKQNEINKLNAQNKKRDPGEDERQRLEALQSELKQLQATAPPKYDFAHALGEAGSTDMPIAIRGNLRKPGPIAPRRFPSILSDGPQFTHGSGRLQLAEQVTSPQNPLTARVFVNRVWMHHFGSALVRSPSNFGALGESPTHPELLDWLAATFVESGWSIKQLHRTILLSSAWRQSSHVRSDAFERDGDNRLLWRMNSRRKDVESWRDTILSITGELDESLGGPSVENILNSTRRTIYAKVSRNGDRFASDEFLRLFDFPMMRATINKRPKSIVPQQYLFMLNSPFMIERARKLAQRADSGSKDESTRIAQIYRLLYGRFPTPAEVALGQDYLTHTETENELTPWQQYAQVLLSANELMTVR